MVLASLFDLTEAAAIWATYLRYYMRADKDDKDIFMLSVREFMGVLEANQAPILYEAAWALSAMTCHHHSLCENYCNRDLTSDERALMDKIEDVLVKMFAETAITTGSQHDPRGITLFVVLPDGRYNNWGGENWRLPMP